ncbi:MAG: tetratricopeptide repeat protein [Pyrinomonadaceae bacterium]
MRSYKGAAVGVIYRGLLSIAFVLASFGGDAAGQGRSSAAGDARSVTIKTQPNAVVWIDGQRYGRTGEDGVLKLSLAPAGRHTVRIRANGYREIERPSLISSGATLTLSLVPTTDKAELAFQEADDLSQRDRSKAIEKYREAIGLRPNYIAAHIELVRRLSEAGDVEAALSALRALRKIAPRNAEASALEGRVYRDTGEDDKAVAAFKRAIAEGRGFQPEALTGLGMLYKDKAEAAAAEGDVEQEAALYEQSSRYFRDAIKQLGGAPDAVVLYQLLGLNLEKQKKYNEAIAVYSEFIRRFPESDEAPTVRSFIEQLRRQIAEDRP